MEVPSLNLFSKYSLKRTSSSSLLKRSPSAKLDKCYASMLDGRQYDMNPFVACTLNQLGRYKIDQPARWDCQKCSQTSKLTNAQQNLNRTYGHTFSNQDYQSGNPLYKSGDPEYPCLIHDPRPQQQIPTVDYTLTNAKNRLNQKQQVFRKDFYVSTIHDSQYQQNVVPQNQPTQSNNSRKFRDVQVTQLLGKMGVNLKGSSDLEFKRRLQALFTQVEVNHSHIQKISGHQLPRVDLKLLQSIKDQSSNDSKELIGNIDSMISQVEQSSLKSQQVERSFFD